MASEKNKPEKQGKKDFIINHLPRDLVESIFLRLPVSTLLKCIGVCKQWYYIIRHPRFVTSHLRDAPRCTLLFFPQESFLSDHFPSDAIIFDEAWRHSIWAVPVIGPDDLLCGSSNWLLCLYTETSTIKIANLATGECLHLDKPVKKLRDDHFSFYRFGFHPVTKEYKVTHFLGEDGSYSRGTFNVIQVYTLGSEKWRDVSTPEAFSLSCVTNSGVVLVDGTMYWLTEETGASWKHAVVSFDLSSETFARIQLPAAPLEGSDSRCFWTTEIDGKEMLHGLVMKLKELFQHLTAEKIRQHVIMELNKILQNLPDSPHQLLLVDCSTKLLYLSHYARDLAFCYCNLFTQPLEWSFRLLLPDGRSLIGFSHCKPGESRRAAAWHVLRPKKSLRWQETEARCKCHRWRWWHDAASSEPVTMDDSGFYAVLYSSADADTGTIREQRGIDRL
ncbi:hypothetical protein PR202_gb22302 [Eleusine coracana subsp. coracana]|uniref:F-box domain-containing protein n=1 Tax=Eleusine coracana subsp. coracana TaxID=191504 RepID=A0AAV5FFW9_ELECO|nr:hypothetical protein PR202_gb22302 [Eleusine coracana subsp. coracana]